MLATLIKYIMETESMRNIISMSVSNLYIKNLLKYLLKVVNNKFYKNNFN